MNTIALFGPIGSTEAIVLLVIIGLVALVVYGPRWGKPKNSN